MRRRAGGGELVGERALALLARADDDRIDGQHARFLADQNVQALRVDLLVGDARELRDLALGERNAQHPARGEPERAAHAARLPLQHDDLAIDLGLGRCRERAGDCNAGVDAPFVQEVRDVRGLLLRRAREEFSNVEADTTRADDRDAAARLHGPQENVDVGDAARILDAGNVERARSHAGRHDHLVILAREIAGFGGLARFERHAARLDHAAEVADGLVELLLAWDIARDV